MAVNGKLSLDEFTAEKDIKTFMSLLVKQAMMIPDLPESTYLCNHKFEKKQRIRHHKK